LILVPLGRYKTLQAMSAGFQTSKHEEGKIDPVELAKYVVAKLGKTDHLKLQKLLYYIQSWHLVMFDTPLFDEDFKAWVHGPVLTSVWTELKEHSTLNTEVGIKPPFAAAITATVEKRLLKEQLELIDDVLEEYGTKSGYHLECLTHSEDPWKNARGNLPPDQKSSARISKNAMRKFYAARLAF
jgi:uncharacterized phage-associated protein